MKIFAVSTNLALFVAIPVAASEPFNAAPKPRSFGALFTFNNISGSSAYETDDEAIETKAEWAMDFFSKCVDPYRVSHF